MMAIHCPADGAGSGQGCRLPAEPSLLVLDGHRDPAGWRTEQLRSIVERTVADVFDVDCAAMRLPNRGQAPIASARQVAMYIAHVGCCLNLTEVGQMFVRDRTTVAYACEMIEKRRDNEDFDRAIELIELVIRVRIGASQLAR
jgi:hypothetical protein